MTAMKGISGAVVREIRNLLNEENCESKKIIVIESNEHELIIKLMEGFNEYYKEKLSLDFYDLTYESQILLLNTNIWFRGYLKYSLTEFLHSGGQPLSTAQINMLNLDASSLELLIKNKRINVWDKINHIDDCSTKHFKPNISVELQKVKEAIESCRNDVFAFLCEENHVKELFFNLGVDYKTFRNVKKPFHQDRIVLLKKFNEVQQFTQLGHIAETCECEFGDHTIHKLKYDSEKLIWIHTYSPSFYTLRYLTSPSLTLQAIKKFLVSPDSPDLIILSNLKKKDLFTVIPMSAEEKYFLKNNCIFEHSVKRAQKKFNSIKFLIKVDKIYESVDGYVKVLPLHTKQNIHWIHMFESDLSYKFVWYHSEEDVRELRDASHADVQNTVLPEASLVKMKQRLILIADRPGMGKSSLLVHFVHLMEREQKKSFIIKIDLNLHQDSFIPDSVRTKEGTVDFILQFCQESTNKPLIRRILTFKMENSDGVVLLCDGFDEMREINQEKFLTWVKFALNETKMCIWVTTRSSHKEKLEDALSALSYSFLPLSRRKIDFFLFVFWKKFLTFFGGSSPRSKSFIPNLRYIATRAAQHCMDVFSYESTTCFFEIPLVLKMSAENIMDVIKNILILTPYRDVHGIKVECAIMMNVNALHIFDAFFDRKCEIYFEKTGIKGVIDRDSEIALRNAYLKAYGLIAIKAMTVSERLSQFLYERKNLISLDTLSKIGMITKYNNAEAFFIHPSFEQYFASNFICSELMSYADYEPFWEVLVNVILVNELSLKFFDNKVKNNGDLMNIQLDKRQKSLVYSLIQDQVNSDVKNVALWEAAHFGLESTIRFLINIIGRSRIKLLFNSLDGPTDAELGFPSHFKIKECYSYGKQLRFNRKLKIESSKMNLQYSASSCSLDPLGFSPDELVHFERRKKYKTKFKKFVNKK